MKEIIQEPDRRADEQVEEKVRRIPTAVHKFVEKQHQIGRGESFGKDKVVAATQAALRAVRQRPKFDMEKFNIVSLGLNENVRPRVPQWRCRRRRARPSRRRRRRLSTTSRRLRWPR